MVGGGLVVVSPSPSRSLQLLRFLVLALLGVSGGGMGRLGSRLPPLTVSVCDWIASGPASVQLAEVCVEGARMLLPWLCEASGAKRLGPEWLVVGSL